MHEQPLHMSRISHAVSALQSITMKNPGELSTPADIRPPPSTSPSRGGCSAKRYDREKRGGLTEGWRGQRKEGEGGEGRKKEQKERRKWRNQRHHPTLDSPGAPLATPFLLPLAHSSSRYSTRPLKALFVPSRRPPPFIFLSSLFTSFVPSTLFLALRHSLLHAMPRLHAYRQMGLLTSLAANVHAVAKLLLISSKLISSFKVFTNTRKTYFSCDYLKNKIMQTWKRENKRERERFINIFTLTQNYSVR